MTLSALEPYPPSLPLPACVDRHEPSVDETATAMRALVAARPWAELSWPQLVESLLALGRTDIPLGRLVEGHIDAVRILRQAGRRPCPDSLYGVWASRSYATGVGATAVEGGWRLHGTLRFASGAGVLDRALVPVWPTEEQHLLLDLAVGDWPVDESTWRTSAMASTRSYTIEVEDVAATPAAVVGPPGFYLDRPGFFPGGVGVAAVWAGGAARVTDLLHAHVSKGAMSPGKKMRLGLVRTDLAVAHTLVAAAASRLTALDPHDDPPTGDGREGNGDHDSTLLRSISTETRAGVGAAVRRLVDQARALAGAAGRAYAVDLSRAIDDLDLYVAQQNPDTDAEHLGDPAP